MSDETVRCYWDGLYADLVRAQDTAMRVLGDGRALELYRALGEARRIAEEVAPLGWNVADRLLTLPVTKSEAAVARDD